MKCERCHGEGELEDQLPMGQIDVFECPWCVGTGLSPESRRQKYAADAVDRAWDCPTPIASQETKDGK